MGEKGYKIIILISVIAIFMGIIGLFTARQSDIKDIEIDSIVKSIKEGSALVFDEVPVKDKADDLQVLRTFVPYGYEVESNINWTLTSYIYPAEASFYAYSKDEGKHLYFFSTKEYIEPLDENTEDVFGGKLLSYNTKPYTGAQAYLIEKLKEINSNASNISIVKEESFTKEEISNMQKIVNETARNIDILLSPDEENEDDEHGYVKIEETLVEPASIIFEFEDNGKKYNQQMSTILTSIIVVHKNKSGEIHRERLWASVAVYGYKAESSVFNENDDIYKIFITNTAIDQRWLTALSRVRREVFFPKEGSDATVEDMKRMAPEVVKKAYFDEKGEFKSGHDLMRSMVDMWDFFNKDMIKYLYLGDTNLLIPSKYSEVYYSDEHHVYIGTKHIDLPYEWNEMVVD